MDQSQIFLNRAFVFKNQNLNSDSQENLIKEIFIKQGTPINVQKTKFLYTTVDYDCYKVFCQDRFYNLKLSLSPECPILTREASALKLLDSQIAPKLVSHGIIKIGDEMSFLISSHENSENVLDLGRGYLLDNFHEFVNTYELLFKKEPPNLTLASSIGERFKAADLKESFLENSISALAEHSDIQSITELFKDIEKEISNLYNVSVLDKGHFCHGDLRLKNIITRNSYFKMVNWGHCFSGNVFLDLSKLMISIGTKGNDKTQLIRGFCERIGIEYIIEDYNLCEKISLLLTMHQLIVDYLYEVYMFESVRRLEICHIINDFTQNFNNFCRFPFFNKKKDFLAQLITEPIVGDIA
jgi:hypothetical protein